MNLQQLKNRFWWLINDNPDNPRLVPAEIVTELINDGIRTLADVIRKVGHVYANIQAGTEAVTLPSDFVSPLKLTWGTNTKLTPIEDPYQADIGSGAVTQYMLIERRVMHLYDTPASDGVLYMWYTKYPTLLTNDADTPSDIPDEHHEALVSVYARAQYAFKMGWLTQYQALMQLWDNIKKEIGGIVDARTKPATFEEASDWQW